MKKQLLLYSLSMLCAASLAAQDMVYRPKNPAFGGETFNYQWLQSSAQAQDTYKDPTATTTLRSTATNSLDDFSSLLNRQVLSSLSRQIIESQFGETGLRPGSYIIGNFAVDVSSSLDGLVVDILDQATGQTTQVVIPFF